MPSKLVLNRKTNFTGKKEDNPTELNKTIWRNFSKKTTAIIRKAEQLYYRSMIDSQNNSSKNLWKTFGKILNKNKIKHNKINQLSHNNSKLTNSQEISETINNFFSEIGPSLASNFDNSNNNEHKKISICTCTTIYPPT